MPPPKKANLGDVANGKLDGWHVSVEGTVAKISTSDIRDNLVLTDGGQTADAYSRHAEGQMTLNPELAPIGSRVEVSGVVIPTSSASVSRVRMRGSQDILLIETPPYFSTRAGRMAAGSIALVVLLGVAWIMALRRAVRRQTAEIRTLLERTQEASRLKSEFLANISHEIRTPLHGVIGLQQMVLEDPIPDRPRHFLQLANHASTHLLALLNDVLDLSAIDRGAVGVAEEPMEPVKVMRDATEMFGAVASNKGLALEVRDLGLPATVMGDALRLKQVLMNLVSNAAKFTDEGSVTVTGWGKREGPAWRLFFEVSDTGIGIPEDQQKHIFEEFRQADGSIRRQYGGSGLGLALAARLAGIMGGAISVRSRPGKGSVFHVEILCGDARTQSAGQEPEDPGEAMGRHLRLLLVEDNRLNQIVATSLLEKDGHSVEVAENGLRALAAHSQSKFDAILMDVQMPEMDGLAATREIRSRELNGQRTPILALTAHSCIENRQTCTEAGMDAVLSKPFSPEQLRDALSRIVPAPPAESSQK
jgi:signal transduction histidine kinase/ActR/RegA family two-component response regulator